MSQDLSIEYPNSAVFITIRTIGSRLWFVNNSRLHKAILGFLAKYQEKFGVVLYGFILMGNHYHLLAQFPNGNRAAFLKAFNSIIARLTKTYVADFSDGKLWARRARVQVVPNPEDISKQLLYVVLNPVSSGLCEKLTEFNSYNCYNQLLSGKPKVYSLIDWDDYKNRSRYNKKLRPIDCIKEYTLTFSRIPGYQHLSDLDYAKLLWEKIEIRRKELLEKNLKDNKKFAGKKILKKIIPGVKPYLTKTSSRESTRPLILTTCMETKRIFLEMYFQLLAAYKSASRKYLSGVVDVVFPPGTYKPVVAVPI